MIICKSPSSNSGLCNVIGSCVAAEVTYAKTVYVSWLHYKLVHVAYYSTCDWSYRWWCIYTIFHWLSARHKFANDREDIKLQPAHFQLPLSLQITQQLTEILQTRRRLHVQVASSCQTRCDIISPNMRGR